jgi:saccharopine dehydrogenase-like NADP-dependent oxidoreductase
MPKAVILGAGMMGSAMAGDLRKDPSFDVTVADTQAAALAALEPLGVRTLLADLSDASAVRGVISNADIVLGALPSWLGLRTLEVVAAAGKDYCDISFMAEDPRSYDALARERGATIVYDAGVAPGMTNLCAGFAAQELSPCERIELYVGGLPAQPRPPFDYKAGFSPSDVLEEYTRPARLVENGKVVLREALSEVEEFDFPGLGKLEAFNTDGLRSLVDLPVPNMKEKTVRYPGHAALMRTFRETGLFSGEPLEIGGARVRPIDVTSALLFPLWKFDEGEADLTVFRARAEGTKDGRRVRYSWELLDRHDPDTGLRSMSRTTGFTATVIARLLVEGAFRRPSVHAPEVLAREPGLFQRISSGLAERGVLYAFRVSEI